MASLPLVGTAQFDVEQFATAESVAFGETDDELRSELATGFPLSVGFYIEVVRLVEDAAHLHVKGIAVLGGVARSEGKVGGGKQSGAVELVLRLFELVGAERMARPELYGAQHGTHA